MIEAANIAQQVSAATRQVAEQNTAVRDVAVEIDTVRQGPRAPFISPAITVDVDTNIALLQIRDSETGEVERTIPSETTLDLRAADRARQAEFLSRSVSANETTAQVTQQNASTGGSSVATPVTNAVTPDTTSADVQQQVAAFEAAARSGNSNAGNVTLFA